MARSQRLLIKTFVASFEAAEAVDTALCRVCLYRVPRAVLLDRILGPAEQFEHVSTTAPSSPPPLIT